MCICVYVYMCDVCVYTMIIFYTTTITNDGIDNNHSNSNTNSYMPLIMNTLTRLLMVY